MEPNGKRVSAFVLLISLNAGPNLTGNVPFGDVWIFTFVISKGQSAISAKTSADAEPASQTSDLYLFAFSSPAKLE